MRQFFKKFLGIETIYKQELLLNKAIEELGFNSKDFNISVDHKKGKNYVNGNEFGIIYPKSFFKLAHELNPEKSKNINFYFNGFFSIQGGRSILLNSFINDESNLIIQSNDGRIKSKKDKFNKDYFEPFTRSKFGLCPIHLDWNGPKDFNWTYRFIESLMCYSIPVLFHETPLSNLFIDGFHYHTIDSKIKDFNFKYDLNKAESNREKALKKFTLDKDILETFR